jgi:hypothetical protein
VVEICKVDVGTVSVAQNAGSKVRAHGADGDWAGVA